MATFGDHLPTPEDNVKAREEIKNMKETYGFVEPDRGNLDDPSIQWRHARPIYDVANVSFFKGKTQNHAPGSLEMVVENLVKTWEMEASHKVDMNQWTTIASPDYEFQTNGGKVFKGTEVCEMGNYSGLMQETDPNLYDAKEETFESSHSKFRTCFPKGFPWEVLKVFSGPPEVAFSWRHWATVDGPYKGREGDGRLVEMYGFLIATVTADLKITSLKTFYKPDEFLQALEGIIPAENIQGGKSLVGDGCPFAHQKK